VGPNAGNDKCIRSEDLAQLVGEHHVLQGDPDAGEPPAGGFVDLFDHPLGPELRDRVARTVELSGDDVCSPGLVLEVAADDELELVERGREIT